MACQYSHTVSDNMSIETFPIVRLSESHQVASPPADWTQTPDRQLLAFMVREGVYCQSVSYIVIVVPSVC